MSEYELSPRALRDLYEIIVYTDENFGSDAARNIEDGILAACDRLAETPGLGHRRSDLTSLPYFFYNVAPYFVVYARQTDPLAIVAIIHASRNVRKLLKARFR